MSFLNWIVDDLNSASEFFYSIYLEVLGWVWPFWLVAEFFYSLSQVFNWLAWDFADFAEWVYDTVDQLGDILSWSNIRSLIRGWLPDLEDVVDWWDRWWVWVGQEIDDWWSSVRPTVQGWIDIATQGFSELVAAWDTFWNITWPELVNKLSTLKADWDTFWTTIFPSLVDFTWLGIWWDSRVEDVLNLIDTAFVTRGQFWEGWQEIRDNVLEFFADPVEWLWTRFTDWFLGQEA